MDVNGYWSSAMVRRIRDRPINFSCANLSFKNSAFFLSGFVNSSFQIRANVLGSRWSNRIYLQQNNLTNVSQCQSLCFLPGTTTCHFYLFLTGICYLGNLLNNSSIIPARTDTQNINVYQGTEKLGYNELGYSELFVIGNTWL